MALPNFFQTQGEGRIASYDFADLASGTGLERFYAASAISGGTIYLLTPNQIYSHDVILSSGTVTLSTAVVLLQEYDFDSTVFNLPRTIKGKMDVLIPWGVRGETGATNNDTVFHRLNMYIVRGETENLIASGETGNTIYGPINTRINTFMNPLRVELPQTGIKKGDFLRANLQQYASSGLAANGSRTIFIGADPQNRMQDPQDTSPTTFSSGKFDTTVMSYDLPFKIVL